MHVYPHRAGILEDSAGQGNGKGEKQGQPSGEVSGRENPSPAPHTLMLCCPPHTELAVHVTTQGLVTVALNADLLQVGHLHEQI